MSHTTNRQAEPEVWFRMVHIAQEGKNLGAVATYRDQTLEIALGPKGTFENGNVGALTRRVAKNSALSAVPPRRGIPKPPKEPKTLRVVEFLRKAIEWSALLESGQVASQADIARREGITRARVTQIMCMLRLAPEIRDGILSIPAAVHRPPITERALRPIAAITGYHGQKQLFQNLLGRRTL